MLSFFVAGGFNPSTKLDYCKKNVSAHLILSGSNDGILGDTFAHKLHSKLVNNSKLVWIAKCGHFPHIEHPQATADAILEFLRTKS
jgi:pimeloyl-ACP methyl ester carboxylesterase